MINKKELTNYIKKSHDIKEILFWVIFCFKFFSINLYIKAIKNMNNWLKIILYIKDIKLLEQIKLGVLSINSNLKKRFKF